MTPPSTNSEDVLAAWIRSTPGVLAGADTDLPDDELSWREHGFCQLLTVAGVPDFDVPTARPVIQVDCCATAPGSIRPPWRKAKSLAEQLVRAMLDPASGNRVVDTPAGPARVMSVYPLTEPRRLRDDVHDFARVSFDAQCAWVRAEVSV